MKEKCAMTQTMVSFVNGTTETPGTNPITGVVATSTALQSRIFDGAISQSASAYYTYQIQQMQAGLSSGTSAGVEKFYTALNQLNAWSQVDQIGSGGKELQSYQVYLNPEYTAYI